MINKTYFDEERQRYALEDLYTLYECAKQAGIDHALFVGFGLLLGIVRERGFIKHDNDIDMCIYSDKITATQELQYYKLLRKNDMMFARFHKTFKKSEDGYPISQIVPGDDDKKVRFTWFSVRKRKDTRCKFCHWFMFPWNGYYWHSKSGLWVTRRKFDPSFWGYESTDDAIMKGIPEICLSELQKIDFYKLKINIPINYGHCLDFWYPGWLIPRDGGASTKKIIGIVKKWEDVKTWRVVIK